jgi:fatty acid amide hydrolase
LARRVEDLELMFQVLAGGAVHAPRADEVPVPPRQSADVRIDQLRIAYWDDDGFFPASASLRRAVQEAAEALRSRGATVEHYRPEFAADAVETFTALLAADGAADARDLVRGSTVDWRLSRLLTVPALWPPTRRLVVAWLRATGQRWLANMVQASRPRSARRFWRLTERKNRIVRRFLQEFAKHRFDAFLSPPHALPAMQHGKPIDLLPAASYAYLPSLLGLPSGVVPATRVRDDEETLRVASRDRVERQARAVDSGSAGLPVGVQVAALPWREDVVLAIQSALESHFAQQPDWPGHGPPER